MAGEKQLFAPLPIRAIAADLSGLQHSVLACVAAHDRLSLVTGKGQGCRASNERMRQMIGCSFARVCSTLTELVDLGFLQREKLGRHTVYRVIYTEEDRLLFGNVSSRSIGCRTGNETGVIGCQHTSETGGNPLETASQYISLNEGIDLEESREENSSEDARFAARGSPEKVKFSDNDGAQMARFERTFRSAPERFTEDQLREWHEWLAKLTDAVVPDDPNYGRAQRLYFDVDMWMWEHGLITSEAAAQ